MGIIDYAKDLVSSGVSNFLKGIEKEIVLMIEKRVKKIQRRLMKNMIAVSLILIAIVFLAISACFLMIEYFNISKTIAFAIIGLLILIIGIIIKFT